MLAPLVAVGPPLTPDDVERFSRHLLLAGFGEEAQRRVRNARVCVLGAGGLGSPAISYLVAAGVGFARPAVRGQVAHSGPWLDRSTPP